MAGRGQRGAALALAVLAAACAPKAPAPVPPPAPVVVVPEPSAASQTLAAHYAQVQQTLLDDGLLRTDGGGPDTPFTDTMLARAFLSIAFQEEYAGGEITAQSHPGAVPLQRWAGPVRMRLDIGASVPGPEAASLRATVASYLGRLSRLTGLQIALDDRAPNFWLHIGRLEERAALGPAITAEIPGLTPGQLASATSLPEGTFCQVLSQSDDTTQTYQRAVAVIPAEHPALLLQACLHEEIAQALGLPNDSNLARPSIFNDDQEFALLTRMDEDMLRILYDPALRPGMTAETARPMVETLATRLLDGQT